MLSQLDPPSASISIDVILSSGLGQRIHFKECENTENVALSSNLRKKRHCLVTRPSVNTDVSIVSRAYIPMPPMPPPPTMSPESIDEFRMITDGFYLHGERSRQFRGDDGFEFGFEVPGLFSD